MSAGFGADILPGTELLVPPVIGGGAPVVGGGVVKPSPGSGMVVGGWSNWIGGVTPGETGGFIPASITPGNFEGFVEVLPNGAGASTLGGGGSVTAGVGVAVTGGLLPLTGTGTVWKLLGILGSDEGGGGGGGATILG